MVTAVLSAAESDSLAALFTTPVQPGTNEVTVTVAVVYVIG